MKIYLVEAYSADIEFDRLSLVVALTPEVCYLLEKAGIECSIIEDFYDEAELLANEDEYYESQLEWIAGLDEFLLQNVGELRETGLRLGSLYYPYLKTFFLDPLCIRCYALKQLFDCVNPSEVVFITYRSEEDSGFRWQSGVRSYYAQVIPVICSERDVPITSFAVDKDIKSTGGFEDLSRRGGLARRIARTLYARSVAARRLYFIYKYLIEDPLALIKRRQGLNILTLNAGFFGISFVIDALKRGHNLYDLTGDSINRYSSLGQTEIMNLRKRIAARQAHSNGKDVWGETADYLEGHSLIRWVNDRCGFDVSALVLPKLRQFVSDICRETVDYYKVLSNFYKVTNIDCVVTPYRVSIADFTAIAAANLSNVKTVCFSHGDAAFDEKYTWLIDLKGFDVQISPSRLTQEYCRALCEEYNLTTDLYLCPQRFSQAQKIRRSRNTRRSEMEREKIVYLPTLYMGDARRLESSHYPDTWYYGFQKSLLEHFSTIPEYTFVWKGLLRPIYGWDPIPDFIRDSNFDNIEIATNPFIEHLHSADRVICDFPCTGFYESVVAGVPTMSLYHKNFRIRKAAVECFGELLKPYSDIPVALAHINDFLNSDPELFKADIDIGDDKLIDILEMALGKRN